MKKGLLLSLILLCLFAKAGEKTTYFVIWAKDGSKVAYNLYEKPKVTFTDVDLILLSNGVEVSYPLMNMARFTYEYSDETSIRDLQIDEIPFKYEGESLIFNNLKNNSTIIIFSIDGILIFKKTVNKKGEYVFPLSNLGTGAFIVNVNGLAYKIVKK